MSVGKECPICRAARGEPPPPGGVVYDDGRWQVTHAPAPVAAPGRLILTPVRHVASLADLSEREAAALGPLLVRLIAALAAETGAARVDVATFADPSADDVRHLRLYLMPRYPDLPSTVGAAACAALARRMADRLRAHRERAV